MINGTLHQPASQEKEIDWDNVFSHAYLKGENIAFCGKRKIPGTPVFPRPTKKLCPICAALIREKGFDQNGEYHA